MNSLPSIEAAEKIVYLEALDYNETWSGRSIRGFSDPETKEKLKIMIERRYDTLEPA